MTKEYNINFSKIDFYNKGILVEWGDDKLGFGELTLSLNHLGNLNIETEYMSKEFVEAVFSHLLQNATYEN